MVGGLRPTKLNLMLLGDDDCLELYTKVDIEMFTYVSDMTRNLGTEQKQMLTNGL